MILLGSTGIDIGLFYEDGNGGIGWRGFAMQNGVMSDISSKINTLRAGSSVYFDVTMATNGVTRCRILDGNDFSNVLYDVSYNVSNKGINRSNVTFNRQMTLCDSQKQYNDGSYLLNGGFDKAYVYASNGSYDKTLTTNTHSSHRGAFGTNSTNRNQVKVNSYQPWYMEDVSINF